MGRDSGMPKQVRIMKQVSRSDKQAPTYSCYHKSRLSQVRALLYDKIIRSVIGLKGVRITMT